MMHPTLNKIYSESKVINALKGDFRRASHTYIQTILPLRFEKNNKHQIIVLPNLYDAQKYYDTLSNTLGEENVLFYPMDQVLTSMMALGSPEFKNERLFTLRKLLLN